MKDYYHILGVLDDAEDIVIKAAYKALAQRYHPDKWSGNKDEATRKMAELNEAYMVLSDPIKRKEYDNSRDKNSYSEESEEDDLNASVESDWKKVVEFFPDLRDIATTLRKISKTLESSYKLILLVTKDFNKRKELAVKLERDFLEKYFGTNELILEYARKLINSEQRGALRALNEAVRLLGTEVHPYIIINKIEEDWSDPWKDGIGENSPPRKKLIEKIQFCLNNVIRDGVVDDKFELIKLMNGSAKWGNGIFNPKIHIGYSGKRYEFSDMPEFNDWFFSNVVKDAEHILGN